MEKEKGNKEKKEKKKEKKEKKKVENKEMKSKWLPTGSHKKVACGLSRPGWLAFYPYIFVVVFLGGGIFCFAIITNCEIYKIQLYCLMPTRDCLSVCKSPSRFLPPLLNQLTPFNPTRRYSPLPWTSSSSCGRLRSMLGAGKSILHGIFCRTTRSYPSELLCALVV